jgi:hypothetical protein
LKADNSSGPAVTLFQSYNNIFFLGSLNPSARERLSEHKDSPMIVVAKQYY